MPYRYLIDIKKLPAIITLWLLAGACTKEAARFPYTDILQFSINDTEGSKLKGVIAGDEIIIYWPPFAEVPDSITPELAVADKAVVTPASGTAVPFSDATTYTVKAENGDTRTYRLKLQVNQPVPYISNFPPFISMGDVLVISGDYYLPDTAQTRAYLVNESGEAVQLEIGSPYENIEPLTQSRIWCKIPLPKEDGTTVIPEGNYTIRVTSGARVATSPGAIRLGYAFPVINSFSPVNNIKKGTEVTLTGANFKDITDIKIADTDISFEILSQSLSQVRIKIPQDAPPREVFLLTVFSKAYHADSVYVWMPENLVIQE